MAIFKKKEEEKRKPLQRYIALVLEPVMGHCMYQELLSDEIKACDKARELKRKFPNERVLYGKIFGEAVFPKDMKIDIEDFEGF